jgi:hypothetical protein
MIGYLNYLCRQYIRNGACRQSFGRATAHLDGTIADCGRSKDPSELTNVAKTLDFQAWPGDR